MAQVPLAAQSNTTRPITTVFKVANVTILPTPSISMAALPADPMAVIVLLADFSACSKAQAGKQQLGEPPATAGRV